MHWFWISFIISGLLIGAFIHIRFLYGALAVMALFSAYALWTLYHSPEVGVEPYNWIVGKIEPSPIFYTDEEKKVVFPQSQILESRWEQIRDEGTNLLSTYNPGQNIGHNYLTMSEEFWKGWTTFPLRVYGHDILSAQSRCPTLSKILRDTPEITTAFFSLMEPWKHLEPHYGPFKGVLRYHLGLKIPSTQKGQCFISVGGRRYWWEDGEGVLFDETYEHYVNNDTDESRLILFLDVKREFSRKWLKVLNEIILKAVQFSPQTYQILNRYTDLKSLHGVPNL